MTLQLSQRALMEALTFNVSSSLAATRRAGGQIQLLLQSVRDPTAGQVVR